MKRIALVFLIAILVPTVILAVMAIRSVRDQEIVIKSQRIENYQLACETVSTDINLFLNDLRLFHSKLIDDLVAAEGEGLIESFDRQITENWSQASVGAVVANDGSILNSSTSNSDRFLRFRDDHSDFLSNRRVVEVYQAPSIEPQRVTVKTKKSLEVGEQEVRSEEGARAKVTADAFAMSPQEDGLLELKESLADLESEQWKIEPLPQRLRVSTAESEVTLRGNEGGEVSPPLPSLAPAPEAVPQMRNVIVQQEVMEVPGEALTATADVVSNLSKLQPRSLTRDDLVGQESEGAVSRIIDGGLHILFWKKHPALPGLTFWTELDAELMRQDLRDLISVSRSGSERKLTGPREVSIALLDSSGALVAQTVPEFSTDWSRPFVAEEIGQLLPRWEVAAYLLDPTGLSQSARTLRLTLSLIVIILIASIAVGSWLILRAVTYEVRLASQKTDFVSNVSHELKTPLTSIRMFSDLLSAGEVSDEEKTQRYASVISKESARLSRLINRLLDFSRLDRGEMKLEPAPIDVSELVAETAEQYREQVEAEGLELVVSSELNREVIVEGDRDAISQVLLNLISNAEKYAAGGGIIEVEVSQISENQVTFAVLDRGPGISKSHERKIFEKFYRIDESINSGIEGSGIGLALSRQIIELHDGHIEYSRRESGGSCFQVFLPIAS